MFKSTLLLLALSVLAVAQAGDGNQTPLYCAPGESQGGLIKILPDPLDRCPKDISSCLPVTRTAHNYTSTTTKTMFRHKTEYFPVTLTSTIVSASVISYPTATIANCVKEVFLEPEVEVVTIWEDNTVTKANYSTTTVTSFTEIFAGVNVQIPCTSYDEVTILAGSATVATDTATPAAARAGTAQTRRPSA